MSECDVCGSGPIYYFGRFVGLCVHCFDDEYEASDDD